MILLLLNKTTPHFQLLWIDFSLTVKAATIIFTNGRGSALRNQVLFIIWRRMNKLFGPRKCACSL